MTKVKAQCVGPCPHILWERFRLHPEQLVEAATHVFKNDATSTVVKIEQDGTPYILKQYHPRSKGAWRARFRPSRAQRNVYFAKRLQEQGVRTVEPLAWREQRGPGRRFVGAFLLMAYVPGVPVLDIFGYEQSEQPLWQPVARAIQHLIETLEAQHLCHHDLNFSNLKWSNNELVLLDLDGMRYVPWPLRLVGWHSRDRQRFLENWSENHYASPSARPLFEQLLLT